jgi:molybdate transport system substrate-binding protein
MMFAEARPRCVLSQLRALLTMLAVVPAATIAQPQPSRAITVAAASDLQPVLPEVAATFEPVAQLKISFGSSGNLFAQIQNGAPFDVFLSADIDYPRRLVASGHADAGSLYQYAAGRIVLWTRKDSGIDVRRGLPVLKDDTVKRIAIANPKHAPYGRAAVAALQAVKLHEAVRAKLVLGENVSQAAQLVDSGNAEVGILPLSLAIGPPLTDSGTYTEIPATAHPPIEQAMVIVSASRNKEAARQFLEFFKRPETIQQLERFGFAAPAVAAP